MGKIQWGALLGFIGKPIATIVVLGLAALLTAILVRPTFLTDQRDAFVAWQTGQTPTPSLAPIPGGVPALSDTVFMLGVGKPPINQEVFKLISDSFAPKLSIWFLAVDEAGRTRYLLVTSEMASPDWEDIVIYELSLVRSLPPTHQGFSGEFRLAGEFTGIAYWYDANLGCWVDTAYRARPTGDGSFMETCAVLQ